ncbi:hypothetical protein PVAP13_1NG459519 [Panicum virgatum]|uniref:Uncharacterized protein n=1 Tax=Panicum virgatum TaxID=38727 RepID=A0A8T0X3Y6_PANVG|nr:hypothetical protein PVAP13_1NG459519 [Panicum virgatum]
MAQQVAGQGQETSERSSRIIRANLHRKASRGPAGEIAVELDRQAPRRTTASPLHHPPPPQTERYGSTTSAARQRRRDSGLGRRIDGEPHAHAGEPTGSMFPSNTAPAKPNSGETKTQPIPPSPHQPTPEQSNL